MTVMKVDIENLSEEELRDLNQRIVQRLKLLTQMRIHSQMLDFNVGERVTFTSNGEPVIGTLIRYNRKTVTVVTDTGDRWNVSPGLLGKAEIPAKVGGGKVIPMNR